LPSEGKIYFLYEMKIILTPNPYLFLDKRIYIEKINAQHSGIGYKKNINKGIIYENLYIECSIFLYEMKLFILKSLRHFSGIQSGFNPLKLKVLMTPK
jgi:hypothetical protein